MVNVILAFCFLAASLPAISAQADDLSKCPPVTSAVKNFQSVKLDGRWYIVYRQKSQQTCDRKCLYIDFSISANRVTNYTITSNYLQPNVPKNNQTGVIRFPNRADESTWEISPSLYPYESPNTYKVLDTDNVNYFTLYVCELGEPKITIFTRQKNPSLLIKRMALASAGKYGFETKNLVALNMESCDS